MMSILLLVGVQIYAAPAPKAAQVNRTPSIYALVYVGKQPKWCPRELHQRGQIAHFNNDEVRKAALADHSVAGLKVVKEQKDAREWLKKNLRVESLQRTNVLRISFTDGSPNEQAAIINAVAKAYHDLVIERQRDQLLKRIYEDGVKELTKFHEKVSSLEKEIAELNGKKAKDEHEAREIARSQKTLSGLIAIWKRAIKEIEDSIRKFEEQRRNLSVFLIEEAEAPKSP